MESQYDRICLVNDAVYVARYADGEHEYHFSNGLNGVSVWTATGAQFQHPYVFKTLFSKQKIEFPDLCEQKAVKTDIWLDMNEGLEEAEKYEKDLAKMDKEIVKVYSNDWKELLTEIPADVVSRRNELLEKIKQCHDYRFVGRVGLFCPIVAGKGGGQLMRKGTDGRYTSVAGTKGYRWLESATVAELKYEKNIDMSYFRDLASLAIETIEKFGNFEAFTSGEVKDIDLPWDTSDENEKEKKVL